MRAFYTATRGGAPPVITTLIVILLSATVCFGNETDATTPPSWLTEFGDSLRSGRALVNFRIRAEYADAAGLQRSEAYTWRLRLGYETADYYGLKLVAELEDVRAANDNRYNAAGLNGQGSRTVVADPESTALNQLYASYDASDCNIWLRVGRQRIILDDARFIGNVGWRQNEQTFDALLLRHKPMQDLEVRYAYLHSVERIFGDQASTAFPTERRDFESHSHLAHATYSGLEGAEVTAFAYFLDFSGRNMTARANSSNTYGVRATGRVQLNEDCSLGYSSSYAHQVDGEDNPTGYRASYFFGEATLKESSLGWIGAGYEHLGSNHGRAQFRTPLATAHKFNGWADSFLDNGGPSGLADIFLTVSPRLPCELTGRLIYHKFNTADGGGDLGWEVDAVVSRRLCEGVDALFKFAYFDGTQDPDIVRTWFQLTLTL